MSVAGGAPAASGIDPMKLRMYGIVGGLVGIYLSALLNSALNTQIFTFLAALAIIPSVVLGANSVRRVCSYGIGTGVPSIGMLALGMGVVASMFGMAVFGMAGVLVGTVLAMVFGFVIGKLTNAIIKLNIPVLEEGVMDLGGAGALVLAGLSVAIVGTIDYASIVENVIMTGYIGVVFIAGSLAILHPFNACLGPDEKQDRTMVLAVSTAALAGFAAGICSLAEVDIISGLLTIVITLLVWYCSYKKFFQLVKRDAAKVAGTGLLPPAIQ